MQILFIGVCLYLILYKSGLATIGVFVFDASASVGAFFIIYFKGGFFYEEKIYFNGVMFNDVLVV